MLNAGREIQRAVIEAGDLIQQKSYQQAYALIREAVHKFPEYRFYDKVLELFRILQSRSHISRIGNYWCSWVGTTDQKRAVTAVRFLNDQTFAIGTSYGSIEIMGIQKKELIASLKGHSDRIRCILTARKGKRILTSDSRNRLRLWDLTTNKCVAYFDYSKHEPVFEMLNVSVTGEYAFSTDRNGKLFVWDLELEGLHQSIELTQMGLLRNIVVDGDEILLDLDSGWYQYDPAAGIKPKREPRVAFPYRALPNDEEVQVLNKKILARLAGHSAVVLCCDLHENLRYVLSGDEAGFIRFWELDWELEF